MRHNIHLNNTLVDVRRQRALCFRETLLLTALNKLQQVGLAHANQLCDFLVTALCITTVVFFFLGTAKSEAYQLFELSVSTMREDALWSAINKNLQMTHQNVPRLILGSPVKYLASH